MCDFGTGLELTVPPFPLETFHYCSKYFIKPIHLFIMDEELRSVASKGDTDAVIQLIGKGANVSAQNQVRSSTIILFIINVTENIFS